ncbi:MAG TPA: HAMP domain-containing sensor histidine kinase [Saprospiraceae bacterium]|nr:HAMP domain-containing sensor histidine kinase [Saprospiraceae bacterium]
MDIYKKRSYWKIIMASVGMVILIITIVYSNYLANQLAESERKNAALYKETLTKIVQERGDLDKEIDFEQSILESFSQPNIIVGDDGKMEGYNFGSAKDTHQIFLADMVSTYEKRGGVMLEGPGGYAARIYVFNSNTLTYIRYFPIVQIILVSLFVVFAYFLFSASRRAEQNRVWAGMAKETAHQLGTPISAIMAWIEHLKFTIDHHPEQKEIVEELEKDVRRLELIADRFSKIGSAPDLEKVDLHEKLRECANYMKRRSPRKVEYYIPEDNEPSLSVNINKQLFDWVIENLIRNALDAMDGSGKISIEVKNEDRFAIIDISDTGKGIPASKFQSVFKPGYSTKQRGWGLGLSLAKRIIEEYHKGKIFVKQSKLNLGTTFTIKLPLPQ